MQFSGTLYPQDSRKKPASPVARDAYGSTIVSKELLRAQRRTLDQLFWSESAKYVADENGL